MRDITLKSYKIRDLWKFFDKQCFAIPELQREFVWDAKKAYMLLDSIYKNLPIGTILIWRTERKNRDLLRHALRALPPFNEWNKEIWFLMDGQQRLSVLYQIREGKEVPSTRGKVVNFKHIHFSLDPEDNIRFVKHRRPDSNWYVRVVDVLSEKWRNRLSHLRKGDLKKLQKCRNKIFNYRVPFVFVKTNDIEEVRESFIRINALGTPISAADRAFARASKLQLRYLVEEVRSQWERGFKTLPPETVNITLALVYGEKDVGERAVINAIDKIEKRIESGKYSLKQFTKNWRFLKDSLGKAIDYLVHNFGVMNYSYLPSNNMIATLSLFFYYNNRAQPNTKQKRELRKWFWTTALGKRYVGRGYRKNILGDVEFFKRLGKNRKGRFEFKDRVPRDEIRRADYSQKAGSTDAFLCLLILKQPKYLESGDPIPLSTSSARSNRKDKHHIFPRELLRRNGFSRSEYNSLCNICFVVAEENQSFGSKKPAHYLEEYRRRKHFARVMKSHLIPYKSNGALWDTNIRRRYRIFLKERLELICKEFEKEAGTRLFRQE